MQSKTNFCHASYAALKPEMLYANVKTNDCSGGICKCILRPEFHFYWDL